MDQLHILEKIKMIPVAYHQEVEDIISEKNTFKSNEEKGTRKLGLLKGKMKMSDDFNSQLDDFKDYMQ